MFHRTLHPDPSLKPTQRHGLAPALKQAEPTTDVRNFLFTRTSIIIGLQQFWSRDQLDQYLHQNERFSAMYFYKTDSIFIVLVTHQLFSHSTFTLNPFVGVYLLYNLIKVIKTDIKNWPSALGFNSGVSGNKWVAVIVGVV